MNKAPTLLSGNVLIETAISKINYNCTDENIQALADIIRLRMVENGHFLVPVQTYRNESGETCFNFQVLEVRENVLFAVAFTSEEEYEKAPHSEILSNFIDTTLEAIAANEELQGLILNPWGEHILLPKQFIKTILNREPQEFYCSNILQEIDGRDIYFANAHINNISFPTTIEGLEKFIYEHGRYNVEDILVEKNTNWTTPRSAKIGDIVLFFHAKTANARISALRTAVKALPDDTSHNKELLLKWLNWAMHLYKIYGGKIFAVGRISASPEYISIDREEDIYHWHGRVYADICNVTVFDEPIDIGEFNSFINISRQSAITPLPSNEFVKLREIIARENSNLPEYFLRCQIGDFLLSNVTKENFLQYTKEYRRRFLLEIDFRSYYVDNLLRSMAETKYYRECSCYSNDISVGFVDNIFKYNDKFYLLEVKLNINLERDLNKQLQKYISADYIYLCNGNKNKITEFERNFMYIIDTVALYKYERDNDTLTRIVNLDDISKTEDLEKYLN